MRGYLATVGNQVLDELDIQQAYFQQDLTEDNFNFYDSEKRNHEVRTLSTGHWISLGIGCFLISMVLISTILEIMTKVKHHQLKQMGAEVPTQGRRS